MNYNSRPGVRAMKVGGRLRDPLDFLAEMFSPPPLPNDDEIALILASAPPEDITIEMSKQSNHVILR